MPDDLFDRPKWTETRCADVPFDQLSEFGKGRIVFCVIVKEGYYQCDYRNPTAGAENLFQPDMPWWLTAREEKKGKKKKCGKLVK
jgi:hypothetical protein